MLFQFRDGHILLNYLFVKISLSVNCTSAFIATERVEKQRFLSLIIIHVVKRCLKLNIFPCEKNCCHLQCFLLSHCAKKMANTYPHSSIFQLMHLFCIMVTSTENIKVLSVKQKTIKGIDIAVQ